MKKIVLVFVLVFHFVFSVSGQSVNDFEYEVNNNQITITGYRGNAKNVRIPERINEMPVIAIGDGAFYENQLTSITLPNSITHIGDMAFAYNQLTRITLPNSIIHIGDIAFYENCLTNITLPNSITHIGYSAFRVNQLTNVIVPNSVVNLADDAL